MKKIVVTALNEHNLVDHGGKTYAIIEDDGQDGIVTYEGYVSMSQTNKSGAWHLFKDGIKIKKRGEYVWDAACTVRWDRNAVCEETVTEPVALFIKDDDVCSRKKRRTHAQQPA